MIVKPKAGLKVPDPYRGDFLPEEGREVADMIYWFRRIEEGDVIQVAALTPTASAVKQAVAEGGN
mgnify:CR=1 FL=1